MKRNRLICLVLIYVVLLNSLAGIAPAQTEDSETVNAENGLQIRLSEGEGKAAKIETPQSAQAVKLDDAETEAILRRLPPMEAEDSGKMSFSMRADSLPPPKTGNIIPVKFPADERQIAPAAEN